MHVLRQASLSHSVRVLTVRPVRVYTNPTMSCPYRAVLLVTRDMRGTSSSIAKERVELACMEPEGHDGPHRDARTGISWDDGGKAVRTFLRHEDEPFKDHYP